MYVCCSSYGHNIEHINGLLFEHCSKVGPGLLCLIFIYYTFEQRSESYTLCSILCPQLATAIMPQTTVHIQTSLFLMTTLIISIVRLQPFTYHAMLQCSWLYLNFVQYYAHEKTCASFCKKLA